MTNKNRSLTEYDFDEAGGLVRKLDRILKKLKYDDSITQIHVYDAQGNELHSITLEQETLPDRSEEYKIIIE